MRSRFVSYLVISMLTLSLGSSVTHAGYGAGVYKALGKNGTHPLLVGPWSKGAYTVNGHKIAYFTVVFNTPVFDWQARRASKLKWIKIANASVAKALSEIKRTGASHDSMSTKSGDWRVWSVTGSPTYDQNIAIGFFDLTNNTQGVIVFKGAKAYNLKYESRRGAWGRWFNYDWGVGSTKKKKRIVRVRASVREVHNVRKVYYTLNPGL